MESVRPARRAVYTALTGGYERLLEQPAALESEIPFICFTDDPNLTSQTWEVRLIELAFPKDRVRSARMLKIMGHESLSEFDETLWIDNTVLWHGNPNELLVDWLASADLAVPRHSFREKLADEFAIVTRLSFDEPGRIYEQLAHYSSMDPGIIENEVYWTGILARRWTKEVHQTMETWLHHVLRYSRRDQLSIGLALARAKHPVNVVALDNSHSQWHDWPRSEGRNVRAGATQPLTLAESLAANLAQLHRDADEIALQYIDTIAHREEHILQLQRQVEAMKSSLSWRITTPQRKLIDGARRAIRRVRRSAG